MVRVLGPLCCFKGIKGGGKCYENLLRTSISRYIKYGLRTGSHDAVTWDGHFATDPFLLGFTYCGQKGHREKHLHRPRGARWSLWLGSQGPELPIGLHKVTLPRVPTACIPLYPMDTFRESKAQAMEYSCLRCRVVPNVLGNLFIRVRRTQWNHGETMNPFLSLLLLGSSGGPGN